MALAYILFHFGIAHTNCTEATSPYNGNEAFC